MIRRGFWLVTGAVLGVTGYRKATQVVRTLTGAEPVGGLHPAAGTRAAAPSALARVASAAGFVREMRAGMGEYWDLHRGEQDRGPGGRTLGSQGDSRTLRPDAGAAQGAGMAPRSHVTAAGDQARREP
jgi:hypothetical protein